MNENYASIWEAIADAFPERIAIVEGERRVSYREWDDRSARLAAALADRGVGHDDMVAAFLYNCVEYLEVAHAAFKCRAVPININYRYVEEELAYVLEDSQAKALVFHRSLADRIAGVRERFPDLVLIQVDDGGTGRDDALGYEELLAAHEPMPRIPRSGEEDHYVLYTGGTTGMPKGVVWRHDELFGTLTATYVLSGTEPPDTLDQVAPKALEVEKAGNTPITMPASPMIHGTAFFLAQTTLVLAGTVVFLTGRHLDAHELWQTVEREKVTQIVIVGDAFAKPMVKALDEAAERGAPYDISSVTQIVSSGVMWTAPVKQALLDRGNMLLADMLGASEGGPFGVSMLKPGDSAETATFTIGPRAKLLRDDDTEIPWGSDEVGVLAVAEPVPSGYFKDPEKTTRTFRVIDGIRYSIPGDYAKVDADGTLHLLGRGSVCINTGGEKVYPEEVEEILKIHADVDDCNVVGIPDDRWGEAITAVVQPRDGASVRGEDLEPLLREHLAGYKVPKHWVFVDRIERSPAGKSRYRWARATAADALGVALPEG
ncbi:MAG: AMP-binding protein [Acidimicrobiia bacterium]|nr:AMP-binding protein [Acidimicrobiia bacterium]